MGLFSSIFGGRSSGIVSGRNPGSGWNFANRFNKAKGGFSGGYGAISFGNIIDAHSSAEEIVDEFGLDQPDAEYGNCYERAYREELAIAQIEAAFAGMFGGDSDPEDYIDWDAVEEKAHDYAIELAEKWISGSEWIPEDVLDWAYYDVSDHNS